MSTNFSKRKVHTSSFSIHPTVNHNDHRKLKTIRTPIFVLLCLFILTVSTADLILGLGLAAYWVALVMPGQLILSIYETYSRYYIVFAIFAILGAIAGFTGVIFACSRKFFK